MNSTEPPHPGSNKKSEQKSKKYRLKDLDLKILKLLDEGHKAIQIADLLDYDKGWISKRIKELESRELLERTRNGRTYDYDVKADLGGIDIEANGVGLGPEVPLFEIHGSEIAFRLLSDFHGQLKDNIEWVRDLRYFKEVQKMGREDENNSFYRLFVFEFSGWKFRVSSNLVRVSKVVEEGCDEVKRQRYRVRARDVVSDEKRGSWAYRKIERGVVKKAKRKMKGLCTWLLNVSNGLLSCSYGRDVRLRDDPWVQEHHFAWISERGDKINLEKVGDKVKWPWRVEFDRSLGSGELESSSEKFAQSLEVSTKLEANGDGGFRRDRVLERGLNLMERGGPATMEDLCRLVSVISDRLDSDELAEKIAENLYDMFREEAIIGEKEKKEEENDEDRDEDRFSPMVV